MPQRLPVENAVPVRLSHISCQRDILEQKPVEDLDHPERDRNRFERFDLVGPFANSRCHRSLDRAEPSAVARVTARDSQGTIWDRGAVGQIQSCVVKLEVAQQPIRKHVLIGTGDAAETDAAKKASVVVQRLISLIDVGEAVAPVVQVIRPAAVPICHDAHALIVSSVVALAAITSATVASAVIALQSTAAMWTIRGSSRALVEGGVMANGTKARPRRRGPLRSKTPRFAGCFLGAPARSRTWIHRLGGVRKKPPQRAGTPHAC